MRKLRVLRIITRLNVGGPAWGAILLHNRLCKDKFTTFLVAGKEEEREGSLLSLFSDKFLSYAKPLELPTLKRNIDIISDIKAFFRILLIIWRIKPDILHTHLAKAGTLGRVAAKIYRIITGKKYPIVFHTFHGHVLAEYFSYTKSKLFLFIERILAKYFSDYIIALSESQRLELSHLLKINPEKIKVINLGLPTLDDLIVDLSKFKGRLKEELKLNKETIIIGTVARLVKIKGLDYLIRAAALILKERKDVVFLIIGDGEEREKLEELSLSLGVKDKVLFLGQRKDLHYIYADLDIALLTSLNEGMPVFLIEALVGGCPVVSTVVGGVKDLLSMTNAKVTIENTRDYFAIKLALDYAISNLGKLKEEAEKSRQKIYSVFNSKRLIEDISFLYLNSCK